MWLPCLHNQQCCLIAGGPPQWEATWAQNFLVTWRNPKQEFSILAQVSTNRGIAKREMQTERTYPSLCTVHYFSRWLTSQILFTYLLPVCLRRWCVWNPITILVCNFPLTYFQLLLSNMQCPFNNNIAFIDGEFLWSLVVNIDSIYVTANFLMKMCTCFCWNQWW